MVIVEYLLKASDIYFELSPKKYQKSWYGKKQAGPDCLIISFKKKHRQLSLRTLESTSLAGEVALTKTMLTIFSKI